MRNLGVEQKFDQNNLIRTKKPKNLAHSPTHHVQPLRRHHRITCFFVRHPLRDSSFILKRESHRPLVLCRSSKFPSSDDQEHQEPQLPPSLPLLPVSVGFYGLMTAGSILVGRKYDVLAQLISPLRLEPSLAYLGAMMGK